MQIIPVHKSLIFYKKAIAALLVLLMLIFTMLLIKRNNPETIDAVTDIAVDRRKNVYITGVSGTNYLTAKYDSAGNRIWTRRYKGVAEQNDAPSSIAADNNGNIYITAKNASYSANPDYTLVKYDPAGNQKWVRHYSGHGGYDEIGAIAVDDRGNVYVTGYSDGKSSGNDIATIKYDPAGNQKWVKRYNSPASDSDWGRAIEVDFQGNVYVAGESYTSKTLGDFIVIKYDLFGNQKWVRTYNGLGNGWDTIHGLVADSKMNVYVTGSSEGKSAGESGYATIKYDSNGNQKWLRYFPGILYVNNKASAMAIDSEGNVFITGSRSNDQDEYCITVKYDTFGNQKWVRKNNGVPRTIVTDLKENIYVAGATKDKSLANDYLTIKYDTKGNKKWSKRYNSRLNDDQTANAIAVDSDGVIYVAGQSFKNIPISIDRITVKYYPQ